MSWEEASGDATLYTWSVVHQNDLPPFNERVPYVAAVVDLAEGPRMMTNVVGCEFDALGWGWRCGSTSPTSARACTCPCSGPPP